MCKKSKFPLVFNIILGIVVTLVMTLYVKISQNMAGIAPPLTFETFLTNFIPGFCLCMTLETIIDLPAMGNFFLRLFGVKNMEGTLAYFLRIFFIALILVVVMSFLLMFVDMGFAMPIPGWLMSLPGTFLAAYVAVAVLFKPCLALTGILCSKEG